MQAMGNEAERAELLAEQEILRGARGLLGGADLSPLAGQGQLIADVVSLRLAETEAKRKQALTALLPELEKEYQRVLGSWRQAADQKFAFDDLVAQAEADEGIIWPAAVPRPLWDGRVRWIVAGGAVLLVIGFLLAYRELRVRVRREWRMGHRLPALLLVFGRPRLSVVPAVVLLFALPLSAVSCSGTAATPEGPATSRPSMTRTESSWRTARPT